MMLCARIGTGSTYRTILVRHYKNILHILQLQERKVPMLHTQTLILTHTHKHTHTHTHIRKFQCYLGLVVLVRMTVMFATHMTKCKSLWNSQVCNMFGSGTAPDPKKKFICLINGRVLNTKVLAYIFATI